MNLKLLGCQSVIILVRLLYIVSLVALFVVVIVVFKDSRCVSFRYNKNVELVIAVIFNVHVVASFVDNQYQNCVPC